MKIPNPVGLVELVTHTSTCINGENVVLRKREWVRSDDPRLPPIGGYKFVCGPTADPASSAPGNTCDTAVPGCVGANEGTAKVESASEREPSEVADGALVHEQADTAKGSSATEPTHLTSISAEVAPQSSMAALTMALTRATRSSANSLIPQEQPQQEATMSSHDCDEENDDEDVDVEEDEQEEDEDDRPWPITKKTLRAIKGMSPIELEALIQNVDNHERWQELREDAKRRTSQWLTGIKKAEEAPRCEFVKANGNRCGSPAVNGKCLCYYHAEAQARREAEEARKLEMPSLEDKLSVQLALVRVCNNLVEKAIDEKTGRAIISALRLAHRNLGDQDSLL